MSKQEYEFNHKDVFEAAKIFKAAGQQYTPGQKFDKNACDFRRLRILWATGFIRPVIKETAVDNKPVQKVQENAASEDVPESTLPEVPSEVTIEGDCDSISGSEQTDELVEEVAQKSRRGRKPKGV